jgi:hypothetical protein
VARLAPSPAPDRRSTMMTDNIFETGCDYVLTMALHTAYVAGVDGGGIDELTALFAPDGMLIVHGGRSYVGHRSIAGYFAGHGMLAASFRCPGRCGITSRHHTYPGRRAT